jgi:hypothetical protein
MSSGRKMDAGVSNAADARGMSLLSVMTNEAHSYKPSFLHRQLSFSAGIVRRRPAESVYDHVMSKSQTGW